MTLYKYFDVHAYVRPRPYRDVPYLFLWVVKRESTPAGEVRADRMVVHHHRERTVHSDVRVHQALELLRVVVSLVSRDDESSADCAGMDAIVFTISSRPA